MLDLRTFFRNHFNTDRISNPNMQKFAEIVLQRIGVNNPGGIYTALLTELTTAYNGYYGNLSDEVVRSAVKEGSTIAMNNSLESFKANVSQKEGAVRSFYGIGSPTYEEFFPLGVSEYTNATLATVEPMMDRMVSAATAHVADLGAPFLTLFTNLRADFLAKRTAQLALIGEVDGIHLATTTTRDVLEIVLMKAVLTVAVNNIGIVDACDVYFDQSFIRTTATGEIDLNGEVLPGKIENIYEDTFTANQEFTCRNTGAKPWRIFLSLTADGTTPAGVTVIAGEEKVIKASELGDVGLNHFLNIANEDVSDTASYEVSFE